MFIFKHNPKLRAWKDEGKVATYYGTFHEGVPNYVTLLGPMTGLGHNSIIFMIGEQIFVGRLSFYKYISIINYFF